MYISCFYLFDKIFFTEGKSRSLSISQCAMWHEIYGVEKYPIIENITNDLALLKICPNGIWNINSNNNDNNNNNGSREERFFSSIIMALAYKTINCNDIIIIIIITKVKEKKQTKDWIDFL